MRQFFSVVLATMLVALVALGATAQKVIQPPAPPVQISLPQVQYVAVDLHGTMPGVTDNWSSATALNNFGEITLIGGKYGLPYVSWMGYPAALLDDRAGSYPESINDDGIVSGSVGNFVSSAGIAWAPDGRVVEFPEVSYLGRINSNGVATAYSPETGSCMIDTWTGEIRMLNSSGYQMTQVIGVNNANIACGQVFSGSTGSGAVWLPNGRLTVLPNPAGTSSWAADINDQNTIVGAGWTGSGQVPIIWQNGTVRVLPTLGREGRIDAVNNMGVAVGNSLTKTTQQFPVVWRNGQIAKLPLLRGAQKGVAYDINDYGWIVGQCSSGNMTHATIWIPVGSR